MTLVIVILLLVKAFIVEGIWKWIGVLTMMSINHFWPLHWPRKHLNKNFLSILPDISYECLVAFVEAKAERDCEHLWTFHQRLHILINLHSIFSK